MAHAGIFVTPIQPNMLLDGLGSATSVVLRTQVPPMNRFRYQDFLNELAAGRSFGIFIDDTGSPGLQATPRNIHPERKSWVAVVVPPELMGEVLGQCPEALAELRSLTGANEFHFADIYAGRRAFKNLNLQVRLALFEFMAYLFRVYSFPVFVQTFDPVTLADIRRRGGDRLPEKVGPFQFTKQEDAALFFLLIRLKWYMEQTSTYPLIKARVFVDEGYKKNGVAIQICTFESAFADGLVCFASSASILPLQLADVAAFALNRTQLIIGKQKRTSIDNRLLEVLSPIAWNYQNIEKKIVPLADEGPLMTNEAANW
jgi:hypothetical protein